MSEAQHTFDREEHAAWRERLSTLRRPPDAPKLAQQIFIRARSSLAADTGSLPGRGMYGQHRVQMLGVYALLVACGLGWQIGKHRTAEALRRLADRVEREGPKAVEDKLKAELGITWP